MVWEGHGSRFGVFSFPSVGVRKRSKGSRGLKGSILVGILKY